MQKKLVRTVTTGTYLAIFKMTIFWPDFVYFLAQKRSKCLAMSANTDILLCFTNVITLANIWSSLGASVEHTIAKI